MTDLGDRVAGGWAQRRVRSLGVGGLWLDIRIEDLVCLGDSCSVLEFRLSVLKALGLGWRSGIWDRAFSVQRFRVHNSGIRVEGLGSRGSGRAVIRDL